jgi:hypothetical protein
LTPDPHSTILALLLEQAASRPRFASRSPLKAFVLVPDKTDRIEILAEKLRDLATKDSCYEVVGAEGHRYRSNPPIDTRDVTAFEAEFAAKLPDDYRDFLLRIGNGGAGPYYGPQRGQVWLVGRVSDQGIIPLRRDFYEWYHRWLNDSLHSLRRYGVAGRPAKRSFVTSGSHAELGNQETPVPREVSDSTA